MKKRTCIFVGIAILLLALIIWTAWGNTALELNTYTVSSEALPDVFDGYRIAHVSDLHNAEMGDGNEKLLAMVRVAIQNFLKNPVISTVLGFRTTFFLHSFIKNTFHFGRLFKRSPFFYAHFQTVSKRVEKPLFLPLCVTNRTGCGCVFLCGGHGSDTDGRNTEKQHFSNHEEGGIRHGSFPHRKDP